MEYQVIEINVSHAKAIQDEINRHTRDGWELHSLTFAMDEDGARFYTIVLEREYTGRRPA